MHRRYVPNRSRREFVTANQNIRYPEVRVLTEHGEMVGIMSTRDALARANAEEKDLVLITEQAKPPVVKIIELNKFKYQQQQKKAEGRKKSKQQDIKEVWFRPFMSDNDFETRLRKVQEFLRKGDKVRMTLEFRGRAITKKDFGFEMFARVIEQTQEVATVEIAPKMMGKKLMAQLQPSKKSSKEQQETAPAAGAPTSEPAPASDSVATNEPVATTNPQ